MCNFVSYFVCVILCIFVFLCDILLPSGVINDDSALLHIAHYRGTVQAAANPRPIHSALAVSPPGGCYSIDSPSPHTRRRKAELI